MFTLLFRKMRNTKWMVFCLLIGFIMASAMMSTIPIYMNASLERMLVKDMETYQSENEVYAGSYSVDYNLPLDIDAKTQRSTISEVFDTISTNFDALNLPTENSKMVITDKYLYAHGKDYRSDGSAARFSLTGMTGISSHIKLKQGRNIKSRNDGVIECIATENSLNTSGLDLNVVYDVGNVFNSKVTTKLEIVGLFDVKSSTDSYWSEGLDEKYVSTLFTNYDSMLDSALATGAVNISSLSERYAIDYRNMEMTNLSSTIDLLEEQDKVYTSSSMTLTVPCLEILSDYANRSSQLKLILMLVQIPVMLMILFYLFMVSQLNVEQEKNEIAVFKSRGASRWQIMGIYALESLILGLLTAVIGPLLGLGLCKILGASNGFLEFVNRTSLPIELSVSAFLYALLAVCVFFFTTLIPIYPATKTSIVEHKASKAGKRKLPLWEKIGLDFILILGSVGWLYYYNQAQDNLISQGVTDTTATVNPILFVASTAFILGAGLLIIRIYPIIIRLIYKLGKRFWSPAQFVSLNNIGRSSTGKERFIMIFLILTVSLGLFFANTARAINRNAEEKVSYSVGCDAVIAEEWESGSSSSSSASGVNMATGEATTSSSDESDEDTNTTTYVEPTFEKFETLTGVKKATKVFKEADASIKSDRSFVVETVEEERGYNRNDNQNGSLTRTKKETTNTVSEINLMTVNPKEFSDVCWFKNGLLPLQINNYLNAISENNSGVILSSSFKEKYGFKLGDEVMVNFGSNTEFNATVVAFVDYFPSLNPLEKKEDGNYKDFAIMNFDYVQVQTSVAPYEVWLDLDDNVIIKDFYKSIDEQHISPIKLDVASQLIVTEKNDPMLQGMNGALTLGFIIIMIMCIIGFLIYWILSIKARTLQFGILRAMGMKHREIIGMLFYEQLLVSGVAIIVAVVVGGIASDLFVPLFQSLYSSTDTIPPFSVVPLRSDYIKIYIIVLVTLLIGFGVLGRIISKIKISQALKLGED